MMSREERGAVVITANEERGGREEKEQWVGKKNVQRPQNFFFGTFLNFDDQSCPCVAQNKK